MKGQHYCLALIVIIFFASCKGYSKYPISEKGTIKVNENMFGIWKAVGDTNVKNYILIQSYDDVHYSVAEIRRDYGSVQRYEQHVDSFMYAGTDLSAPREVDTIAEIERITKSEKENEIIKHFAYWVTRFTVNGKNPHYQQWDMHEDKIKGSSFFTSDYRHMEQGTDGRFISSSKEEGYLTYKMLKASKDSFVVCVVADPAMKDLGSSDAVRERIERNINSRTFYSDTVHFYKVKGGHFGLNESMELADQ